MTLSRRNDEGTKRWPTTKRSWSSRRGAVTLITLNRPQALNALNSPGARRADRRLRRLRRRRQPALRGADRQRESLRRRRRHQGDVRPGLRLDVRLQLLPGLGEGHRDPQAVDRRGRRLCARRRLRGGDDGRFHHRRRQRQIRPARDQARRHARHGRLAAPDPRDRQGQGDGDVPDRPDDGRRGGRALRPGRPGRARPPNCSTRR